MSVESAKEWSTLLSEGLSEIVDSATHEHQGENWPMLLLNGYEKDNSPIQPPILREEEEECMVCYANLCFCVL